MENLCVLTACLLLFVQCGCTSAFPGNEEGASRRALLSTTRAASGPVVNGFAQLSAAIVTANKLQGLKQEVLQLTQDVILTRALPKLDINASLSVIGACKDAKGLPRTCVIDGVGKFPIFTPVTEYTVVLSVKVTNLIIQNAAGGGVFNLQSGIVARKTIFRNNFASGGPAVVNLNYVDGVEELLFFDCEFINNTAGKGDGGVLFNLLVPTPININRCIFQGNRALSGRGGAIASLSDTLFIRSSQFIGNTASKLGGAIYTEVRELVIIDTSFTGNKVLNGKGGAVSSNCNQYNPTILYCNSSFKANLAPSNKKTGNMFLFVGDIRQDASINFCKMSIPSLIQNTKPKGGKSWSIGTNCSDGTVGCTGCINDCNVGARKGKCVLDADEQASCSCVNKYDPNSGCTSCSLGYDIKTDCTACAGGFVTNSAGHCSFCKAFNDIDAIGRVVEEPFVSITSVNGTHANSALQCQQFCNATKTNSNLMYCNEWAYFFKGAQAGCASGCLLLNVNNICDVSKIFYNSTYAVYYQDLEYDVMNCV
eukprot:TRINITY_DN9641_c0_g1_i4.p1 TRINITY_DN9641_c0_g1~~TRINITY_DN9641_c0_g1_i4.p1  ORF type:complete len:538 (-),score=126.38 TRINITY_DN9641_c0_g1_i4:63-1676(-)